jgi:hypothetical protein
MAEESSDEDGISKAQLDAAIKKVKGKISILKMRNKMKMKRASGRAVSRIKDLQEVTEGLESKGIAVNKESLATRVKNPRRIADLEAAQDKKFKQAMGVSDDSDDDGSVEDDEDLRKKEQKERGRRGATPEKKMLGKRQRKADSDEEMLSDDDEGIDKDIRGSKGKNARSMTPA